MRTAAAAVARQAWPLGVAAAAFTLAVGFPASDPDMWWHLASGRWMVEHRTGLRVDVFSSTVTGTPYALGEAWGEIVLYLAYLAGSWTGVAILRGALVATMAFGVTRAALRSAPPPIVVPLAAIAIVLSKPTWTDRPQLWTLALFAVLLDLLLWARAGSRRALIATVPVVLVWSALHAGYALGIALLWAFAVAAIAERRPAIPYVVAAAAATILVAFDPAALPLLRAVDHVGTATRGIVEESPVDVLTPFGALFALAVCGTLAAFLIAGADVLAALVLAPMLLLALSAQRHIPLFGIAAVPFVAGSLVRAGSESRLREAPVVARFRSLLAFRWTGEPSARAVTVATLWIGAIASIATGDPRPDLRAYPTGALQALRASSGVVLNEYDWGGYLIWNAPERPVFIDGRLFPFLADDVLGGYRRAVSVLPGWRAVLDRWNVTQALLRSDRPLAQALREEGWTVRAADRGYLLLERPK